MLQYMFSSITGTSVNAVSFFICSAVSIILGAIIALIYKIGTRASSGFLCALAIIPLITQTVIMMVSGSLGAGLAVAGAFSLIRFRSIPGTAKEICSIFLAMTVGIASGMGYIGVAIALTVMIEAISTIIFATEKDKNEKSLRITVPETLNHNTAFDDLFEKYTVKNELISVRTQHMGTLYRLEYLIILKDNKKQKDFIDELRCRNGNLDIICSKLERGRDEM